MINIGSLLGVQKTSTTSEYLDKGSKPIIAVAMFSLAGIMLYGVGKSLFSKNGSISKPQKGMGNNRPPKKGGMVRGISSEQRGIL